MWYETKKSTSKPAGRTGSKPLYRSSSKIDEAINRYRRAIEIRPYYAEAHYNLATAIRSQENIDEAMSHYRQAIRIKPDYAQAHSQATGEIQTSKTLKRSCMKNVIDTLFCKFFLEIVLDNLL